MFANIAHQVAQWLEAYPHRPIPPKIYDELDESDREAWELYFAGHPDRVNIFELAPRLRTGPKTRYSRF